MMPLSRMHLLALCAIPWATACAAQPFMETTGKTSQPIGHYEFCRKAPSECRTRGMKPKPEAPDFIRTASRINLEVNRRITAATDPDHHGITELWDFADDGKGDCEDYALLKRRMLREAGVPAGNLLMTVAAKPDGEVHAVLTLRLADGDYVLDNLRDEVVRWDRTGYRFMKRQSEKHAGTWLGIAQREVASAGG